MSPKKTYGYDYKKFFETTYKLWQSDGYKIGEPLKAPIVLRPEMKITLKERFPSSQDALAFISYQDMARYEYLGKHGLRKIFDQELMEQYGMISVGTFHAEPFSLSWYIYVRYP